MPASGYRYLPNTQQDRAEMLAEIGISSVEELLADIPVEVRLQRPLELPAALSEPSLLARARQLADRNTNLDQYLSFLGAGIYEHFPPSVIQHLISRSEFYTAYTPYQAEISQGTLRAIFEYQTMISELTGLPVANASMYDAATAVAEAMIMAIGATRRSKVLVSKSVHPAYRRVLATYAWARGVQVGEVEISRSKGVTCLSCLDLAIDDQCAAVIIQTPNFFGCVEEAKEAFELAHRHGALAVAVVDPVSLAVLAAPAEYGADIVVGEGQGLGLSTSYGGPLLGFLAASEKLIRRVPGRIVGQTTDREGRRGFVLTLQAREQHIRREKATSNICSNEALCALAATIYLAAMGPTGLRQVGEASLHKAHYLADRLGQIGLPLAFEAPFFKEFAVDTNFRVAEINQRLLEQKIIGGYDLGSDSPGLSGLQLFCVTEVRTKAELDRLVGALEGWL